MHRSRGLVARFALLLAFNSFAAGFVVQSLVAYWFHVQFGADAATLGLIFFLTNTAGALSYLAAARIASRIGLINTMVFTHLPSNLLLMLVPVMPTLPLAAVVLIMRHALSQMDRPARESYIMAIVAPDERTAAAGAISIAMMRQRHCPWQSQAWWPSCSLQACSLFWQGAYAVPITWHSS